MPDGAGTGAGAGETTGTAAGSATGEAAGQASLQTRLLGLLSIAIDGKPAQFALDDELLYVFRGQVESDVIHWSGWLLVPGYMRAQTPPPSRC